MEMQDIDYAIAASGMKPTLSTVKETPLTRLSYAVEHLRKADALASETATKLVGERGPEAGNSSARAPIGSGFLGSIEELADSVNELASNIAGNMQRVERRL